MFPSKRPSSEVEVDDHEKDALFTRDAKRRIKEHGKTVATSTDESTVASQSLSYPPKNRPVKPVAIQYPTRLLTFSYDADRTLHFDDSAMKYFVNPPMNADLKYGYTRWIKRPEEKGRIDGLLKAMVKYCQDLDSSSGTLQDQSDGKPSSQWLRQMRCVSWRGVMTKTLTALYEERDGWELNVMHINNLLYLEEHLSDKRLAEKEDMTPYHRQLSYYGYSFESFSTSSQPYQPERLPGHPPGWSGDVNTNVQWCSVVKTKLGSHRLLIGGEVDCVTAKQGHGSAEYTPDNYVELKTSMAIRGANDEVKFERKLLKFYFQSFLLGVPEIVVGFRTPQGRVVSTQTFKTMELPRLVRGKPHGWDPHLCMHWGDIFLNFLLQQIPSGKKADKTHEVWRAKFIPGTGVTMKLLDEAEVQEVRAGEDRVGFLPRWYFHTIDDLTDPGPP
ncbi:RAI1 like PD-XK nuclease-domain-containing protein [Irpex rosettiformis]|uniref:RAI1 like PD-XK nuclease-domain-containing protein n=1 Tax=Irpex rosettiformis TaxID=378272 RepID=A0ACB8UAA2_9APHY|nr:RAI1 like PD-XK nuclease-domain-containing protein [Irpex rosettiformis]